MGIGGEGRRGKEEEEVLVREWSSLGSKLARLLG